MYASPNWSISIALTAWYPSLLNVEDVFTAHSHFPKASIFATNRASLYWQVIELAEFVPQPNSM